MTVILSRRVQGFQRFFEMGQEESVSPFLSEEGKRLSRHLALKKALVSAFALCFAWILQLMGFDAGVPFLVSVIFLLVGSSALSAALDDIFLQRDVNIDVLMTVAAFGALAMGNPLEGSLLLVLYELSTSLEDFVTYKAKRSLLSLGELNPEKALCVAADGSFVEKAVQDVEVGQVVLVRPGEIVPLDGVVVQGQAGCSLAHITGEDAPLLFSVGDSLASGAKVLEGSLHIRTEVTASQSTLSKLVQLITRARSQKPALAQLFDVWGRWYAISVLILSCSMMLFFFFFTQVPFLGVSGALYRALTFLITASPCALILAVPISYVSALGALVRKGVILKGGIVLDQLDGCRTVAFDKTGTLTTGCFHVTEFTKVSGAFSDAQALSLFASIEQYAVHPLAQAVVQYAKERNTAFVSCFDVQVEAGKGISCKVLVDGAMVPLAAGSRSFIGYHGSYKIPSGSSEIWVSLGSDVLFVCFLKDTLRPESESVIHRLHAMGKRSLLISGDKEGNVQAVAVQLGIQNVYCEATPEEKLAHVSSFLKEGLVMVGDGLNDAPALARATVGISMGAVSSASAREASDVILLRDDLVLIPWLFQKARQTRRVIRQNLACALLALMIGSLCAILGLIPIWCAVLLHEGSTLLVGLNSLRLLETQQSNPSSAKFL